MKLKKILIICEVLIIFIILAKITTIGGIIKNSDAVDFLLPVTGAAENSGVAEATPAPVQAPESDIFKDRLSGERKLMSSLVKKKKVLEDRENFLNSLSNEILSEIDRLSEIEGRLNVLLETFKEMDNKKYKDLAKVYESTPPDRAGPMLEKLDSRAAASIIMNMKGKKAGAIWGYIKPSKAVEITSEIIKSGKIQK